MRRAGPLRVLIVDDSAFMRSRIQRDLLGAGFEVVGEARNGQEAAQLYASLRPDLVTMDLTMREHDGIEGATAILAMDPGARIVLFSIVDDAATVAEALGVGIRAYVHKGAPTELVRRLREIGLAEQ
jgi:two-component system, chemotaxis family, chemotaxis protein CheY